MFSLKDPLLLKFDEIRKEEAECKNLKNIYDLENITSDSGMREIGYEIDPKKYIFPMVKVIFRHLRRGKELKPMVFYSGRAAFFSGFFFPKILAPNMLIS